MDPRFERQGLYVALVVSLVLLAAAAGTHREYRELQRYAERCQVDLTARAKDVLRAQDRIKELEARRQADLEEFDRREAEWKALLDNANERAKEWETRCQQRESSLKRLTQ